MLSAGVQLTLGDRKIGRGQDGAGRYHDRMWEPSDLIALGAVIVAAISVLVAALSLAHTWRDRRGARSEGYRNALYERQLSAVEVVVAMLWEAHGDVLDGPKGGAAARFVRAADELSALSVRSVFMPPEVVIAGGRWIIEAAEALGTGAEVADGGPAQPSRRERLDLVWRQFVRRVHTEIGADQLHQEVRERTGAAAAQRRLNDRFARIRNLDLEVEVMSRGRYKAPSDEELWRELGR